MSEKILDKIIKLRKQGMHLFLALKECKLDKHKYYQYARASGIPIRENKRKRTYTKEIVKAVRKRIATGEYLKDVCKDMGLDKHNLSRFCRVHGLTLYNKKDLESNYIKRGKAKRGKKMQRYVPFVTGSRVPTILGYLYYGVDPIDIGVELTISAGHVRRIGDMFFPDWEDLQD